MPQSIPVLLPGKAFRNAIEQFHTEVLAVVNSLPSHPRDFPMRRLFELISFTQANKHFQDLLIARGSFIKQNERLINTGEIIDETVGDPQLRNAQFYIPEKLEFTYNKPQHLGDALELLSAGEDILVVGDFGQQLGWGKRFIARSMKFEKDAVHYVLFEENVYENGEPQHLLEFIVDMNLEPDRVRPLERELASKRMHFTTAEAGSCDCFGIECKPGWGAPPITQPDEIPTSDVIVGITQIQGEPYFFLENTSTLERRVRINVTYEDTSTGRRELKKWGEWTLAGRYRYQEELDQRNATDWQIEKIFEVGRSE